jgi:hypothetical protein
MTRGPAVAPRHQMNKNRKSAIGLLLVEIRGDYRSVHSPRQARRKPRETRTDSASAARKHDVRVTLLSRIHFWPRAKQNRAAWPQNQNLPGEISCPIATTPDMIGSGNSQIIPQLQINF